MRQVEDSLQNGGINVYSTINLRAHRNAQMEVAMRTYETMHLVKNEDLNHHGTLFAARAAAWVVEAGFAAAACEHGSTDEVVMRNLQNMSFQKPVQKGTALRFISRVVYTGTTSLMVAVAAKDAMSGEQFIEGYITFVTIEAVTGRKMAHSLVLDDTKEEEELQLRKRAEGFLQRR